MEEMPALKYLFPLKKLTQNIYPEAMGREEGCIPSPSTLPLLAHTEGDLQVPGGPRTTQPVESSLRSEMQRKFLLQPPLSREQSRTGPKESRRTSRLSKEEEVISSSL